MNNKNGPASAQGRTPVKKRINKKRAYFICTLLAAVFILAMAVVLMSVSDNRAYNDYMNQAQQLYYNKDYDGALSVLRKAASIEKTDECQLLMASCYENQGNYTRALEVLRGMDTRNGTVSARIEAIESTRRSISAAGKVTVAGREYPAGTTKLVLDNQNLGDEVFDEILQLYGLDSLSMANNHLRDLSRLSALGGLVTLNLSSNNIQDLTPLQSLTGLKTLYLDDNPVQDLTPLTALTGLTSLSIKGIAVTEEDLLELSKALPSCAIHSERAQKEQQDISFGGTTFRSDVTELDLSSMGIRDISALANCQYLTRLNLSGNSVSDLSPLMNLPYLSWLDISDNQVTDLRPLMGIGSLSYLDASGNSINATSALTMMNGLTSLTLDRNPIRDFSGLRKLRNLGALGLAETGLTDSDLSYLKGLAMLYSLNIENNPALTGEAVDELRTYLNTTQIRTSTLSYAVVIDGQSVQTDAMVLNLAGTGISDLTGVQRLGALQYVDLSQNRISNLYPFEQSESRFSITGMNLSYNQLSDITPLSLMPKLETLDLSYNDISSLQPLMNMSSLHTLVLTGNPVSMEELSALQNVLFDCDIIF